MRSSQRVPRLHVQHRTPALCHYTCSDRFAFSIVHNHLMTAVLLFQCFSSIAQTLHYKSRGILFPYSHSMPDHSALPLYFGTFSSTVLLSYRRNWNMTRDVMPTVESPTATWPLLRVCSLQECLYRHFTAPCYSPRLCIRQFRDAPTLRPSLKSCCRQCGYPSLKLVWVSLPQATQMPEFHHVSALLTQSSLNAAQHLFAFSHNLPNHFQMILLSDIFKNVSAVFMVILPSDNSENLRHKLHCCLTPFTCLHS